MDTPQIAQLLAGTEMFGKLDDHARHRLAERAVPQRLVKGQTVFLQAAAGDSLYVVLEGLVKVFVTSTDGDEMVLTTLRPPDVFGELTVLDGGERSASRRAWCRACSFRSIETRCSTRSAAIRNRSMTSSAR